MMLNMSICMSSYFPLWVREEDLGSDCPGSWSLVSLYLSDSIA